MAFKTNMVDLPSRHGDSRLFVARCARICSIGREGGREKEKGAIRGSKKGVFIKKGRYMEANEL